MRLLTKAQMKAVSSNPDWVEQCLDKELDNKNKLAFRKAGLPNG